ncbi:hypothetical protein QE411_002998 [Microbacterium arborescens]|nr:hypothetical protein [Microbacterium arborescens]
MSVLLDPAGPFAAAGEGRNRLFVNEKGAELPYTASAWRPVSRPAKDKR